MLKVGLFGLREHLLGKIITFVREFWIYSFRQSIYYLIWNTMRFWKKVAKSVKTALIPHGSSVYCRIREMVLNLQDTILFISTFCRAVLPFNSLSKTFFKSSCFRSVGTFCRVSKYWFSVLRCYSKFFIRTLLLYFD